MSFKEYYYEVSLLVKMLGYSDYGVKVFKFDIQESYENGQTVQECVDLHF